MTSYSAPLKRFRLVIALGVVVGAALALTSAYKVELTWPPELTAREEPSYTAGTQLEVSSRLEPYYRTAVDVPIVLPSAADGEEEPPTNLVEENEPVVTTLVTAANYYPYVIEGDNVRALRERLYGVTEGQVEATAIGATITPSRFEPGRLPFIQVVATSNSPENAIKLAQNTADAFIRYVQLQQERGNIRPQQRLLVKQLRKPERTFQVSGTSLSLPLLVFAALVLAAVALAYLLDRLFPRRVQADAIDGEFARREEHEQPLVAASGREA